MSGLSLTGLSDCFFFVQAALEDAFDSTTLGDLWFERGELKEARAEHLRALKIRTARLEPGHPDVAESLESLGNVAIREVGRSASPCLSSSSLSLTVSLTVPLSSSNANAAASLLMAGVNSSESSNTWLLV